MRRSERTDSERAVALTCYWLADTPTVRLAEWTSRTGKSRPAFYRRLKEAMDKPTMNRLRREYLECDNAWRVWRERQEFKEWLRRQIRGDVPNEHTRIPERED